MADKQSTAVATRPAETQISYVPLGETDPITLTLSRVKTYLCLPTKSGKLPSDEQVMKFIMLCKAQSLNPWLNDAFLVGYDGQDGPTFSLITAHQALLKRAEASPEYDGMESGVIVMKDGTLTERPGDLILPGETLIGGWGRVHRRDRSVPSYDSVNLKTFDTGRSRWKADPCGMITKCAEASALRKAFPSTLAAMYCKEEMDRVRENPDAIVVDTRSKTERLTERLVGPTVSTPTEKKHKPATLSIDKKIEQFQDDGIGSLSEVPSDDVKQWAIQISRCDTEATLTALHNDFDAARDGRATSDIEAIEAAFASRLDVLTKGAT